MAPESRSSRAVTPEALDAADIGTEIKRRYLMAAESGLPKHTQLRKAVLSCIEGGLLRPGSKLPSEQSLTVELGLSLGTVRRALEQLAASRVVVREHGHGTFVAERQRPIDHNWHFRFFAEDGKSLLPVYSQLLSRSILHKRGDWTDAIGDDEKGYVRIERTFNIDGRFTCFSEFYLPATRFAAITRMPAKSLEAVNLKHVLAGQFNTATTYVTQRARAEILPDRICQRIAVPHRSAGLHLQLTAFTFGDIPISYHEVWVPATRILMDLAPVWSAEPKH